MTIQLLRQQLTLRGDRTFCVTVDSQLGDRISQIESPTFPTKISPDLVT